MIVCLNDCLITRRLLVHVCVCVVSKNKQRAEEIKTLLEDRRQGKDGGSAAAREIRAKLNDTREKFKELVVCVWLNLGVVLLSLSCVGRWFLLLFGFVSFRFIECSITNENNVVV